jgi:thiamine-phosphate pyrophosphorylase
LVDFSLYLITDRKQTAGRELPAVVADALRGGVRAVQLREKDLPEQELFELALTLRTLTRQFSARLLINSSVEIAQAVDADGVHLGKSSRLVAEARHLLAPGRLIGYSAHSMDEALQAEADGADFITFGPVYYTPSKAMYGNPLGIVRLAEAAQALKIPVFALGGVKKTTVCEVMAAGAAGIALISAIISAPDPQREAEVLLQTIDEYAITP